MVNRKPHKGSGKRNNGGISGNSGSNVVAVKRGDVFWATLPEEAGSVQKGTRPVLVVQNDIGNRMGPTVIVASVTSRLSKRAYPVNVNIPEGLLPKASEVRLSQIRTLDKGVLGKRIARLPAEVMQQVDEALRLNLGLPGFER